MEADGGGRRELSVAWTEEQKKVITVRNKNVLVSAAAGSGKTAVLVERILSLVCGEGEKESPLDVDRLLVVTFTKAAAAEMRERVGLALEQRLEKDPQNEHLQKQQTLIHNAQITTIHSFCQYVIRNYFHQIDLDPSFRIGDEGELRLLKGDVIKELLEEHYAQESPEFTELVETYATGKSDAPLEDLVLQLYEAAVSYPYPKRWLEQCKETYRDVKEETVCGSSWMKFLLELAAQTFSDLKQETENMIRICRLPGGPYMYEGALQSDLTQAESLLSCSGYEEIRQGLSGLSFARLSPKKDADVEEEKKEMVKAFRDGMKKSLKDMKEKYFSLPIEGVCGLMEKASSPTGTLLDLAAEFSDRYQEKKRLKNLADFSDLEHLALEILVEDVQEEGGKMRIIPSDAAKELSGRYAHIMIDEYQDSNLIQEIILNSVSKGQGKPNVFMVGDVKQSIYRFRLARPELFMEKYQSYPRTDDADEIRIDLHRNFRSRQEVLEGANSVFGRLMTEAVGGIRYDSEAALYPGASMPEEEGKEKKPEFLLLEKDASGKDASEKEEDSAKTDRELEAQAAAERIRELLETEKVWDKDTKEFRPVRRSDIVILLRSLTGWGDVFARVLTAEGIPAHTESRTGYFTTIEIATLLNILRITDNSRQDIPLAAVMKSMIGGFSDADLAKIRSGFSGKHFFAACMRYREEGGDGELKERLNRFYEKIGKYRRLAQFLSIHELIEEILSDTGYGDYLKAQPGGAQRSANVRMLVEKALAFEKTSYRGLFHFVRYIEQLQTYQEDFGEAGILGENEDAVRIMTIHKSKGLEFPVVIAAGMGKSFNRQDSRSRVVIHPDLGVGVDWVDTKRRTKTPTLPKRVLQKALDMEMLGEELRVLYVAFTRAKEKLIVLGSAGKLDDRIQKTEAERGRETLSFRTLSSAGNYLDWLLPAICSHQDSPFQIKRLTPKEEAAQAVERQLYYEAEKERLLAQENFPAEDEEYARALEERLSFEYPYQEEADLRGKLSVSELKRSDQEEEEGEVLYPEEEIVPYIPAFMQETKPLGAAARGTAYHRALECLDFQGLYHSERVREELARLVEEGRMTKEQEKAVRPYDIYVFAQSALAKRMTKARKQKAFFTEQPFVIRIPANELYPERKSREPILVQGIIDAYFYEENENGDREIVITDYKTDYVKTEEELLERYKKQLDYYGLALERLTGLRVREKLIYSFCLGREIPVD